MLLEDLLPIPKPKVPLTAVWALTLLIAALCMALRVWWIEPLFPTIEPKGAAMLPFAVLFGLGVATVVCLAYANRGRWRVVFHANKGRLIGAAVLSALTPVGVFAWIPFFPTGLFLFSLMFAPTEVQNGLMFFLGSMIVLFVFWYPVSCLIVSGIKSRWMRVWLFSLMFWTTYSAVLLLVGNQPGIQ